MASIGSDQQAGTREGQNPSQDNSEETTGTKKQGNSAWAWGSAPRRRLLQVEHIALARECSRAATQEPIKAPEIRIKNGPARSNSPKNVENFRIRARIRNTGKGRNCTREQESIREPGSRRGKQGRISGGEEGEEGEPPRERWMGHK